MMIAEKVDHILRAAGAATGEKRFVLIGSAAIFAWSTTVPPEMALTREVDLFASGPDLETIERIADDLDASLGQASQFDQTYGYYCDGVGPETAILPTDWRKRAKEYSGPGADGVVAIVPHPNDIALSKLCAGREKDLAWLAVAIKNGIVDPEGMRSLFGRLPDRPGVTAEILAHRLQSVIARARSG